MIAVGPLTDVGQGLAAVGRAIAADVEQVDGVFGHRIGDDVRVVEGPLADVPVVVRHRPRLAAIVRGEEAAFFVFDQRVDTIRVGARHRDTNLADHAGGETGAPRDLGPGITAVGRFEQAAAGAAARHLVLDAIGLPQRRVDHVGILRIDREIDRAGLVVAEEGLLPGLAAVDTLEDAAFGAGCAVLAERCDEDDVRVRWMDADLRDRLRVGEADVGPGLAGIRRPVDAVPRHDVAADAGLPHADEHQVGVGLGDRHRADRGALDLAVGHRQPVLAAVGRLPEAAAHRAEVRLERASFHTGDRDGTAAAVRADTPPFKGVEHGTGRPGRLRTHLRGRHGALLRTAGQQRGGYECAGHRGSGWTKSHSCLLVRRHYLPVTVRATMDPCPCSSFSAETARSRSRASSRPRERRRVRRAGV